MWCGPLGVNLKRGEDLVGHFPYDTVLSEVRTLLDEVIAGKAPVPTPAGD
jgi:hypothetical protein